MTAQKRDAASLIARGASGRQVARSVGINRRTVARWLVRPEFVTLVDDYVMRLMITRGGLCRLDQAYAACEEAAVSALASLDHEAWSPKVRSALAAHRAAMECTRAMHAVAMGLAR